jgi:SOS-response transcriptional repressor LexA
MSHEVVNKARGWAPTRRNICEFIVLYTRLAGYPPTTREIADGVGLALSSAHDQVERLVARGIVERADGARTLRVLGVPQ